MAKIRDGWYEAHWPHGEGSDVAQVYSRYDGQYVQLSRFNAQKVELLLAQGYTFAPFIAMTPERVEALREAADLLSRPIYTNKEAAEFYAKQVEILRAMLDELEVTPNVD